MGFFKKHLVLLSSLGILLIFFLTRLINLTSLPIFTDEAIYIRWAQIAGTDANWRFISLTDGKQPLFVWIAMILLKFIEDPLFGGRLVSVLAGLGSVIGIFFLTNEIFKNRKIGLLASLIYALYPFSLVYDRLALYDSLVAMTIIWALYFEVLLVRYVRLDLGMILGMIIGVGMLTKTNAFFAMILLPFSLLLFNWKDKQWKQRLGKWIIFAAVALVIANAMYLILRLSPFFHIIAEKNYVFIYPVGEWVHHPFTYFTGNFHALFEWLTTYLTWPFFICILASFLVGKKYLKELLFLSLWFIIPFMALALFGRVIYPRFILFMTMPLLVLGAYSLYHLLLLSRTSWLKGLVVVVFLGTFLMNDYFIVTDLVKAGIPTSDKKQFVTDWPAGVGVPETVTLLTEKAKTEKIYVATEGTFGLMPYALEIYFHTNSNVIIKGFWPINDTPPKEVLIASKTMPTYVVFYQPCPSCSQTGIAPAQWPVKPVLQIKKGEPGSFYTLYQVIAP